MEKKQQTDEVQATTDGDFAFESTTRRSKDWIQYIVTVLQFVCFTGCIAVTVWHSFHTEMEISRQFSRVREMTASVRNANSTNAVPRGREFILAFLPTFQENEHYYLIALSSSVGTLELSGHGLSLHTRFYNITPAQSLSIHLPHDVVRDGTGVHNVSLTARSTVDVTLLGLITHEGNLYDTFLVLATELLSNEYIVFSHTPHSQHKSQFSIVAYENDTFVQIQLVFYSYSGESYSHGETIEVQLDNRERYQFRHTSDLTGTLISSSKVIAVYSGVSFAMGIRGNMLLEQLLPCTLWSHEYVVPTLGTTYILKIAARKKETRITIRTATVYFIRTLTQLGEVYIKKMNGAATISATEPVGIVQIVKDLSINLPESKTEYMYPSMSIVVPMYMYRSQYHVYCVVRDTDACMVSIIIETNYVNNLLLNNASITPIEQNSIPHPFDKYSNLLVEVGDGLHYLEHMDTSITFGAVVLNYYDDFGSRFGNPCGLKIP